MTPPVSIDRSIQIPVEEHVLTGNLIIPAQAKGLILFAHGSGSSRLSPRNQSVARVLNKAGFGTLLFDLLTREEEEEDNLTREYRFDINLLANRLVTVTDWILTTPETKGLIIGYFGASTGAAAALLAAAQRPQHIKAIVSRGGRPDLAEGHLESVQAPTLLIVGGRDYAVIELNEEAFQQLSCLKEILIIPGATHLFEEPGKLEEAAKAATQWFKKHLV